MHNILAGRDRAIRQSDGIAKGMQQAAFEQLLAGQARFEQMSITHRQWDSNRPWIPATMTRPANQSSNFDGPGDTPALPIPGNQVPSIWTTAFAHNAIRPPGTNPSSSTSAPLIDSTARTSSGADTVLAVMGSSKYITLTTRR